MELLSVSDAVRRLALQYGAERLKPADITGLFYSRRLADDTCPIVAGRRLIPENYLAVLAMELRRAGKLPRLAVRKAGAR